MRFGVHLPLMDFGGERFDMDHLVEYVDAATSLGFDAVSANDHMVLGAPWLDGPTALGAVVSCSGSAKLFTTVANPVVRGPVVLAKTLAALEVLSAVRRGEGWLASAYNTTPEEFKRSWDRVQRPVGELGRDPTGFDNGLATMWFHIDDRRADDVPVERLAPVMHRPVEELRERLALGSADAVVEKLAAFRDAGAQRMFLWPVTDDIEQLQRFGEQAIPRLQN